MSSIHKLFNTDRLAEVNGIEVTIGDAVFLLARAGGGNKAFTKALERNSRPHRRAIQLEAVSDEVATEIVHRTYAETVVKDWRGVDEGDLIIDQSQYDESASYPPLAFSVENAVKLFRAQPDLFVALKSAADDFTNYRRAIREGDAGN
ncbi:hypothetical protein M0R72_08740 [Candidatus Pacearchaeota archaeon]|jgi:hypothetical protein|nr:hypothetical protein [Candidatus Pacearchaeota archaeon]